MLLRQNTSITMQQLYCSTTHRITGVLCYLQQWRAFLFFSPSEWQPGPCLWITLHLSCCHPLVPTSQQWETARWQLLHSAGSILRRQLEINQQLTNNRRINMSAHRNTNYDSGESVLDFLKWINRIRSHFMCGDEFISFVELMPVNDNL